MARPRRQDPDELRRNIVSAARDLLREGHVEGLSARSLARALSIAPSAIYRIFPTMADVLMEVNRQTFGEIDAMLDRLPQDLSPEARLLEAGDRYMDFMQANPNLWRALFEGSRGKEGFPAWYAQAVRALLERLGDMLRQARPELGREQALGRAERLYLLAHGAIALHLDGRLALITPASAHDIIEEAIRAMLAGVEISDSRG
jgi:AcrR family transcriptional regulator